MPEPIITGRTSPAVTGTPVAGKGAAAEGAAGQKKPAAENPAVKVELSGEGKKVAKQAAPVAENSEEPENPTGKAAEKTAPAAENKARAEEAAAAQAARAEKPRSQEDEMNELVDFYANKLVRAAKRLESGRRSNLTGGTTTGPDRPPVNNSPLYKKTTAEKT